MSAESIIEPAVGPEPRASSAGQARIQVIAKGPYRVTGAGLLRMRPVVDSSGDRVAWDRGPELEHDEVYELCRCGASRTKPFCDGSEKDVGFDGTEVADRAPTATRRRTFGEGPVALSDDVSLCAKARFCMAGSADAWELATEPRHPDRAERLKAMVGRCPSGRLVYLGPPAGSEEEAELPQEVGVVNDGPLWVRGGITVEAADGSTYEVRNRVTLCRCGQSENKPFCDGSHVSVGFRDP
jgi:CDGSH-type Zn-finger protein